MSEVKIYVVKGDLSEERLRELGELELDCFAVEVEHRIGILHGKILSELAELPQIKTLSADLQTAQEQDPDAYQEKARKLAEVVGVEYITRYKARVQIIADEEYSKMLARLQTDIKRDMRKNVLKQLQD